MKIAVIEPLAIAAEKVEELRNSFSAGGHELVYHSERTTDPDELAARAAGAQIVVIANAPFPGSVVSSLPDLKLLAVAFTGVDHVDLEACKARGIRVSNASGYSNINVAELTIGLMIDVLRNITRLDPITRRGGTKDGLVGFDLCGKTVGIVGTGAIGTRVAELLAAFEVKMIAYNRTPRESVMKLGVEYVELEKLFSESDIVTLHLPLNSETRGMISGDLLKRMKRSAYLINCARGPIVDADALHDALKSGAIAGAGIDVFDGEPPLSPQMPLLTLENVVVTPHIAFATAEAFVRRADIVRDNILAWLEGKPQNVVV
ncbi:MAG: NAD(P)-dependent oxidoreductase [Alkalispirochaetaceae bacterium]